MIQNIMKHLKRRDLKDRILNRSTLCLPQCTVKFAEYQCIAGIPAKIVIEAREKAVRASPTAARNSPFSRDRLIQSSRPKWNPSKVRLKTEVMVIMKSFTFPKPLVRLKLLSSATPKRPFTIPRAMPVTATLKSTLDKSGLDEWKAGEGGLLRLQLVDAYGNKIDANDCVLDFKVRCVGPGRSRRATNVCRCRMVRSSLNSKRTPPECIPSLFRAWIRMKSFPRLPLKRQW